MKKFLKSLLVLLFVFASLGGCSSGCFATIYSRGRYTDSFENVNHALNSTVALMIQNPMSGEASIGCTGFFISPTRIATAEHCVAVHSLALAVSDTGEPSLEIVSSPPTAGDEFRFVTYHDWSAWTNMNHTAVRNPASHIAKLAVYDVANDLAILIVENPESNSSQEWFQIRDTQAVSGEPVFAVGQPLLFRWAVSEGIVSYVEYLENEINRTMIGTTVNIYPGSSGGPLFDNYGRIVGVADAIAFRQPTLSIFVPANNLIRLIATIPTKHQS